MRKLVVCAVAVCACVAIPTVARADFPIVGWVDGATATYVTGWAINCPTGVMPNHLDVLDYNATTTVATWLPVSVTFNGARPDVQAAYAGSCAGLTPYLGYTAVYPALGSGEHFISAFWSDFYDHAQSATGYVVVP